MLSENQESTSGNLEHLRQRANLWTAMGRVGRVLSSSLEVDRVLDLIINQATEVLNAEGGSLLLMEEPNRDLVFKLVVGPKADEYIGQRVPWGEGLAGESAKTGKPLVVNQVSSDPRWYSGMDDATDFVTRDILVAPMISRQEVIGVIEVVNKRDLASFTEDEADILFALASQAAVAIENARLYEGLRKRYSELEALYSLAMAMSETLSLPVLLNNVLDRLPEITGYAAGAVMLVSHSTGSLELEHQHGIPSSLEYIITSQPWAKEIMRRAIESGQAVDSPFPDTSEMQSIRLVAVPLVGSETEHGVLVIPAESDEILDEDQNRVLTTLGRQLGMAIENATLYSELQKHVADQQRVIDELAELDRLKDEMIQNLSHELRTPLTFIQGYIGLLIAGEMGEISESQLSSLKIVSEKTGILTHLVNEILTVETVKHETLNLEPVILTDVADRVIQAAAATAVAANVVLHHNIDDMLQVRADPIRVTQVFDNLVQNGIKFNPNGGTVSIHSREDDDFVWVDFVDDGIGIAPDQMENLFDRFYQVDGSMTRHFGGTGLGLALCKQIMDAHKGKIEVASELGKGSTFSIAFPKQQEG
ncbi:MAG: GAF domain-containing protein [Chloroflexota bacterium]